MRRASKNAKISQNSSMTSISAYNFIYAFLFCRGKCEKKVYLFSDLGSPFGNDQLDTITEGLKSLEIQFTLM